MTYCVISFVNLKHLEVFYEKRTSVKELPLSDRLMGMPLGYFPDQ